MGIAQQRPNKFNLYDIFANFLPGAVLLVGILFPYVGTGGLFTGLTAGGMLVILVLSFAGGLFVQAVGGSIQSSGQDFENHIQNVDRYIDETNEQHDGTDANLGINISPLDAYFVETFRAELGLTSDFDDWSRLHKLILAKLEATSRTRALRLQALFLAMRGMAVTMALLALWFLLYTIVATGNVLPVAVPVWILPCLSGVSIVAAGILYSRGGEFSRDVAKYMIIEYYLEILSQRNRTVELDFLDEETQENTRTNANGETEPSKTSNSTTESQFERAKTQLVTEDETDIDGEDMEGDHDSNT